ncbi:hypothetical protein [Paenibacillus chitinolyticus]
MGMSDYYRNLREKVGSERIFVPSVAGIVRNEPGDILLQNKGNGEKWSLPVCSKVVSRQVVFLSVIE